MIKDQRIIELILIDEAVIEIDEAIAFAEYSNNIITFGDQCFSELEVTLKFNDTCNEIKRICACDIPIDVTVLDLEKILGREIVHVDLPLYI